MRIIFKLIVFALILILFACPLMANPFSAKANPEEGICQPETQSSAHQTLSRLTGPLLAKTIIFQHHLRNRMTEIIRNIHEKDDFKPLILLMGIAFIYGMIHAAGPGHGKFVAVSYVLSGSVSISKGLMFAVSVAFFHGFSGIIGVLGLQWIIRWSANEALATVTGATRIVSLGMITVLGIFIFLKNCLDFLKSKDKTEKTPGKTTGKSFMGWAAALGIVPCPAVVMVMLFCLSMDALLIGVLMAICISIGMAATIASAVAVVIIGKTRTIKMIAPEKKESVEAVAGILSGAGIAAFGVFFLLASIIQPQ